MSCALIGGALGISKARVDNESAFAMHVHPEIVGMNRFDNSLAERRLFGEKFVCA